MDDTGNTTNTTMDTDSAPAAESNVLFVGNLSWNVRDEDLAQFFTGTYTNEEGTEVAFEPSKDEEGKPMAKVILDKMRNNRSKGYGFVTFDNVDQARAALTARQEQELDARAIRIQFKTEERRERTGGGDRRSSFGGNRSGGDRKFGGRRDFSSNRDSRGGSRNNYNPMLD